MSELRMSLQEYNEIKEKMDRQERILQAILTPEPVSEWDITYHKSNPHHNMYTSSNPLVNLTKKDKDYLCSLIYRNASVLAEEQFSKSGDGLIFDLALNFQLGYFKLIEVETKEDENDG